MSNQKKFFYVSAICSCCLSLYLATYLTLLSFIAAALGLFTFLLIIKVESIKEQKDWKKKEFFKYFLIVALGFHITVFYNTSAEICYLAEKKDQLFVDFDTFILGKFFPKGQISLWLDVHPTLNPETSLGIFFNTIFQFFYMIYYLIPVISVFGYPLTGVIKETIYLCKNNGVYSDNYDKAWDEMYFFGSCFIHSYMPVIFGNTLFPAWSPRLYLQKEYKTELKFYYLIQKISIRKNKSANSFPSGHVSETSVYIFAMHLFGYKKLEIFSFICSFMIALSTVVLRYHYFADVCISIAIAYWAFYLVYRFGYLDDTIESDYMELSKNDLETNLPIINKKDNLNLTNISNEKQKIKMHYKIKVLIFSFIIFSFISLLERSDYINLIIAVITLYYFIIDNNRSIIKYLKHFIWLLGGAIFIDLIWLRFGNFFVEEANDPEKGLKRIIFLISIYSTVFKCYFIYIIRNLEKEKIQDIENSDETEIIH